MVVGVGVGVGAEVLKALCLLALESDYGFKCASLDDATKLYKIK